MESRDSSDSDPPSRDVRGFDRAASTKNEFGSSGVSMGELLCVGVLTKLVISEDGLILEGRAPANEGKFESAIDRAEEIIFCSNRNQFINNRVISCSVQ